MCGHSNSSDLCLQDRQTYVSVESHSAHLYYFQNPFSITPSPALRVALGSGACSSHFRLSAGLYPVKFPVYHRGQHTETSSNSHMQIISHWIVGGGWSRFWSQIGNYAVAALKKNSSKNKLYVHYWPLGPGANGQNGTSPGCPWRITVCSTSSSRSFFTEKTMLKWCEWNWSEDLPGIATVTMGGEGAELINLGYILQSVPYLWPTTT